MKLPAYPRYKPSGVEWLGDVPEHWEVKRFKQLVSATDDGPHETPSLRTGGLSPFVAAASGRA